MKKLLALFFVVGFLVLGGCAKNGQTVPPTRTVIIHSLETHP